MATAPTNYLTPEDYLRLERSSPEKHEYSNGQMLAMAGANRRHRKITRNIIRLLEDNEAKSGCTCDDSDTRLFIPASTRYTYPDAVMTCGEVQRFQDDALDTLLNPTLIVEVLSPSTDDYDRGKKFHLYQSIPSFAEYLLVSQDEVLVEQRVRLASDKWEVRFFRDLDQHVTLEHGGFRVSLDSIYAGIKFDD